LFITKGGLEMHESGLDKFLWGAGILLLGTLFARIGVNKGKEGFGFLLFFFLSCIVCVSGAILWMILFSEEYTNLILASVLILEACIVVGILAGKSERPKGC